MGDGGFTYAKSVSQSKKTKDIRVYFSLQMFVVQLKVDTYLLRTIANILGPGTIKYYEDDPMSQLVISDRNSIQHIILPFFSNYPLLGNKKIQFDLWIKAVLVNWGYSSYSKEKEQKIIPILMALSEYQSRAKDKENLAKYLIS